MLSGCSTTVPVKAKFPEVPDKIMELCPDLQRLQDDAKLSDVAKNITVNFSFYYECASKHEAMVEWYKIQKKIYEDIK
jgi:hypothetical protein